MRRKWIVRTVGVLVVLAIGTLIYLELQWQPRITKVTDPVILEPGMRMNYSFHQYNPFRDDVVWIKPFNPKRSVMKQYLFDLKQEKVTHIAENVEAIQVSRKYNSTLGSSFGSLRLFLRWKIQMLMDIREEHQDEFYFALDFLNHENGEKMFLETVISVIENSFLSPDGRYAKINVLQGNQSIVDFQDQSLTTISTSSKSWEGGWLSKHECFYRDSNYNVVVFDVRTQESTVILTPAKLSTFLAHHDLRINQNMLFTVRSVPTKNGDRMIINGNHYFNSINSTLNEDEAWVVEIDRESRELKLLHERFPHQRSGKWNSDLTKYLYSGEKKTNDTDAVYVYDVFSEEVNSIENATHRGNSYSLPNFYGDQIIYVKENAMWIVNDDGTAKRQLFPPVK